MRVFKYPLSLVDTQIVDMPEDSQILHVAFQDGHLHLWARVHPERIITGRRIFIVGTGHILGENEIYIGTVHDRHSLVWHVFDGGTT